MISLADLNNDVRLAVDTGKVSFGHREVLRAVNSSSAKAVIIAEKGRKSMTDDINHVCKVAGIRVITFRGSSMELATVCGRPYSVNSLAILDAGNSTILNENY
jgi:large subunit ribosomal protein L30e